jgi:hypothetical protein
MEIAFYSEGRRKSMNDSMSDDLDDQERAAQSADMPQPRAVGSPLPKGSGHRAQLPQGQGDSGRAASVPPPGRALANSPSADAPEGQPSSLQRAISALRLALPLVQRILPLLDGNIATAVSNILNPHPQAPPPFPPVNLAPIEDSLTELQTQHRDLRNQVVEQNSSLKRVEDQLEMVREATDRNTLEQQELLEDLKTVGNKVNVVAIIALGLLVVAVVLNLVLYLHIQRVLP